MKFFVDTANVEDIKKANDMGVICGVTTNPSLIAKAGRDFVEVIKEITSIVDGPISGEVKATTVDAEGMITLALRPEDIPVIKGGELIYTWYKPDDKNHPILENSITIKPQQG
jgi:hypothetical protein